MWNEKNNKTKYNNADMCSNDVSALCCECAGVCYRRRKNSYADRCSGTIVSRSATVGNRRNSCRAGDGTSIPDGHPDNGYGQVCDCWRRSATKKECIVSLAGV